MTTPAHCQRWLQGWPLCVSLGAAVLIVAALLVAVQPDVTGARNVAIFSARAALVLFCLAFAASSAQTFFPSPVTRWLLQNRRYLGGAFAIAHTVHLCAVVCFAIAAPPLFETAQPPVFFSVLGAIGYLFMYAMVVTSFDPPRRWLSGAAWERLHTVGSYYLWSMFISAFSIYTMHRPTVELHVVLCMGGLMSVMALRVNNGLKRSVLKVLRATAR